MSPLLFPSGPWSQSPGTSVWSVPSLGSRTCQVWDHGPALPPPQRSAVNTTGLPHPQRSAMSITGLTPPSRGQLWRPPAAPPPRGQLWDHWPALPPISCETTNLPSSPRGQLGTPRACPTCAFAPNPQHSGGLTVFGLRLSRRSGQHTELYRHQAVLFTRLSGQIVRVKWQW